ncbi:MAG: transporter substrate-binding domain-containing protein [Opitutales bacterium]|nr:transporter substrate-binding domain-containing protein [Opitutales bacterium]
MKKCVLLMLAVLAVAAFVWFGNKGECTKKTESVPVAQAQEDYAAMSLEELKPLLETVTEGRLTVATSPDFAPYEFYALDSEGNPNLAGFDLALAGYIADYLGLELEIIPMDFDGVIMELQSGSVDIGMAGFTPDPVREAIMDFSKIYYQSGQSFICLKSNKDRYPDLAATDRAGLEIGAQTGSIQIDLAKKYSSNADIVPLAKVPEILAEVLSGKLDGAYIETPVAKSYQTNYPELCVALDVPCEIKGSAIGVTKNHPALLAAINFAVTAALDDGSMARFIREARELADGNTYEGLLGADGKVHP